MIDVPILVKDALRDGTYKKNYRFNVLNNDGTTDFTIDNNTLVKESVSIDERMCSGDLIKFGLCEGSSLEFQYFNHPNITNRRIQAFIDVEYERDGTILEHEIPMGFFEVKESSRQASTGIIKVVAYNKLQSDYLDAKATDEVKDIVSNGEPGRDTGVSNYYLLNQLLQGYGIDNRPPIPDTMNSFFEGNLVFDEISEGSGNNALGKEPIRFILYKQDKYDTGDPEYIGAFAVQRKSIFVSKMTAENGVVTNNDGFMPIGYHYVKFNPNIAPIIKNAYTDFFAEYQDDNFDIYYVKAYVNYPSNTGARIKLRDFLAMINDEAENIQAICPVYNNPNGTISHIDSMFKGLVALDNNLISTGFGLAAAGGLKKQSANADDYRYYQFITPGNKEATKLLYIPAVNYSDSRSCNCARLVLPSAIYWTDDIDDIEEGHRPIDWYKAYTFPWHTDGYNYQLESKFKATTDIENYVWTTRLAENLQDVTARDLQSAIFEINCEFGQLDRVTDLFSGHELNGARLLPQETLYPDNSSYQDGGNLSAFKSMYSKLWADEGNIQSWRYLIITYKGLDEGGNEKEYKLQRTINEHGTQNYNCSDNWLFRNLIWTSEQVGQYADAMVQKMRNITWFPFEMWCAGLPYVETGDEIEIAVGENTYTTYVLQRQLKGIQNLQDTYINGTLDIY